MSKNNWSAWEKISLNVLFVLVCLACLSPLLVFGSLLFPFVTSKAFFFRIFIELALPFYLYLTWMKSELRVSRSNPVYLSVAAFLTFGLISSFAGVNPHSSIWGNFERMGGIYYLSHLAALFLYVVLLAKAGGSYLKNFLYYILVIATIVSLNGIFGKLGWGALVKDASLPERVSSTLGNPIFLASYLIIPLGLSAFFARQAVGKVQKFLFGAIIVIQLTTIFLSGTRGAVVGLAVGTLLAAVIYLFLESSKKSKMYAGAGIMFLALVLCGALFFKNSFSSQGFGRLLNFQDSNSKARLIQWKSAWQGFVEKPFFGAGPENYYYVSNKYYNPEMLRYDSSWFDKPHNYLLEVLSTHGAFGFVSYLGIIIFVLWALFRAYREEVLDLVEMCVLSGAFVAYFIQNLFVFDTVSAAMIFYAFAGFAAFLWDETRNSKEEIKSKPDRLGSRGIFGRIIFGLGAVVVLYAVGVTNFTPMSAAKNVNAGVATMKTDPEEGDKYFQEAINSTFNFSMQDTAIRYSEKSRGVFQDAKLSQEAKAKILNEMVKTQKISAENVKNDPLSWIKLSYGLFILDVMANRGVGEEAEKYAKYALSFAPNRYEPYFQLYQIYDSRQKVKEEGDILVEMNNKFPLTEFTAESRWALVYWDYKNGKEQDALNLAEILIDKNYPPQSLLDILWLLNYYDQHKNYVGLLAASKLAVKGLPDNQDLPLVLAQAYASNGMMEEAVRTAQVFGEKSPENQAKAKAFLDSIQK